jgi:hypothetical protein
MDSFKEHTTAAIYYTELTEKYLRSKAAAKAEVKAPEKPAAPAAPIMPAEPIKPPEPATPIEAAKPAVKAISEIKPVLAKPASPKPAGIWLTVALSEEGIPGLVHRSRQQTLEALEEGDVAWVDGTTVNSLHMIDHKASIVLPDGREQSVTIKEMAIRPVESRYIILPRKLRNRLSIDRGTMVEVKA